VRGACSLDNEYPEPPVHFIRIFENASHFSNLLSRSSGVVWFAFVHSDMRGYEIKS
jgi:hypothetical protein